MSFTYSGRFNLRTENAPDFPAREIIRNDLREAYLTWQSAPNIFMEIGRINLKNGIAEGFSRPTLEDAHRGGGGVREANGCAPAFPTDTGKRQLS